MSYQSNRDVQNHSPLLRKIATFTTCLVAAGVASGCASTKVTSRKRLAYEKLPRPNQILLLWRMSRRVVGSCIEFGAELKNSGSYFLLRSSSPGFFLSVNAENRADFLGMFPLGRATAAGLCFSLLFVRVLKGTATF